MSSEDRESPTAVVDALVDAMEEDDGPPVVAKAVPATVKAKAVGGGKNFLWRKLATEIDTDEGKVKDLDSWPLEGWEVSKHTKTGAFWRS